jgi:double-stranded RNA-binding protein Staufen
VQVTHQYILSDEQGPAHRKVFFVTLKLGDEEYKASGPSIKVAQHTAARQALDLTKYNKPASKSPRPQVSRVGKSLICVNECSC